MFDVDSTLDDLETMQDRISLKQEEQEASARPLFSLHPARILARELDASPPLSLALLRCRLVDMTDLSSTEEKGMLPKERDLWQLLICMLGGEVETKMNYVEHFTRKQP
ncbi:hypothetical protein GW17_00054223 [Ensete ventricosum]|nr:hypothetical protein GW17_00054223 [Ensete ventricosum]